MSTNNFYLDTKLGAYIAKQGTTLTWVYRLSNDDGPIDVTNFTNFLAMVRQTYDSDAPLITMSVADGNVVNGGLSGTFTITLAPSVTTPIEFTGDQLDCVLQVEVSDSTGFRWRLDDKPFIISREVAR